LLLDVENTEDRIITVSREKIGQEILRLRGENTKLQSYINKMTNSGGGAT
jgi:hypothetical protein